MTLYDARLLMAVERERNGTRASWLAEEALCGFPEHRYSAVPRKSRRRQASELAAQCTENERVRELKLRRAATQKRWWLHHTQMDRWWAARQQFQAAVRDDYSGVL